MKCLAVIVLVCAAALAEPAPEPEPYFIPQVPLLPTVGVGNGYMGGLGGGMGTYNGAQSSGGSRYQNSQRHHASSSSVSHAEVDDSSNVGGSNGYNQQQVNSEYSGWPL